MTWRALAALALGSLLLAVLPGTTGSLHADPGDIEPSPLLDRYRQALAADPGNLTLHYLLGVALLQENDNTAAMRELQIAYPAYHDSIEAHYNLGVAALRLGDLESTEIYLEQAEALGAAEMPGSFPLGNLYFNMALRSMDADDDNEAIRYFHKVMRLDPDRYEVHRQLGDLYARNDDDERAMRAFRRYLERFPDDTVSRDYLFALEFNRAQDLLAAGDLSGASEHFSAAISYQSGSPIALYYLGYIAYSNGDPGKAVSLLGRAWPDADDNLQKSLRPLLYNCALALRRGRKLQDAASALAPVVAREDANFDELFLAGTLNLDLRRHRAARQALLRAVTLAPDHAGAQQNLLRAERGAFREWLDEAARELEAQQLGGADAAIAEALALQPRDSRATELRERITQARSSLAATQFVKARDALATGNIDQAFREVTRGLSFQPENSDGQALHNEISSLLLADLTNQLALADEQLQAEAWEAADKAYTRVLLIDPQNRPARQGREQVHKAKAAKARLLLETGQQALDAGQAGQASEAFSEALALSPTLSDAESGLTMAREMTTNRVEEHLRNGRRALENGEFAAARDWFEKGAQLAGDDPRLDAEFARLDESAAAAADKLAEEAARAVAAGQLKSAERLYARALEIHPGHARARAGEQELATRREASLAKLLTDGTAALNGGDYGSASRAYRTALEVAPGNRQALDGLARCRERQADELERLVAAGKSALEQGDLATAGETLDQALKLDAYHKGAQALRQRLESVRLAGARPGDEQRLYLQGVSYYTQGRYDDAIEAWQTVLLLDPAHEKSRQNIDKTRRKLRQLEEYRGG